MKKIKPLIILIIGLIIGFFLFHNEDSNAKPLYGENNAPKNCRALILENEKDYYLDKKFTNEELLMSIFRNCGQTGYLWKETKY